MAYHKPQLNEKFSTPNNIKGKQRPNRQDIDTKSTQQEHVLDNNRSIKKNVRYKLKDKKDRRRVVEIGGGVHEKNKWVVEYAWR